MVLSCKLKLSASHLHHEKNINTAQKLQKFRILENLSPRFTEGCTAHVTALKIQAHPCKLGSTGAAELGLGGERHRTPQSQL